jgi:hypothetical protein
MRSIACDPIEAAPGVESKVMSKKQAGAVSDALLHGQRSLRQRRDTRLIWYPELEKIPLEDWTVALKEAKGLAWRSWSVGALFLMYILCFFGWMISAKMGFAGSDDLIQGSLLLLILGGVAHRWATRRELRRSEWRRGGIA